MSKWYCIRGKDKDDTSPKLLAKLPGAVTTRGEAEEAVEEFRRAGYTDLTLTEVEE